MLEDTACQPSASARKAAPGASKSHLTLRKEVLQGCSLFCYNHLLSP